MNYFLRFSVVRNYPLILLAAACYLSACMSCQKILPDIEENIFKCLSEYGVLYNADLDEINGELSAIDDMLTCIQGSSADNNLVLASLSIFVKNGPHTVARTVPIVNHKNRRIIFESTAKPQSPLTKGNIFQQGLKNDYTLQKHALKSIPTIVEQQTKLWERAEKSPTEDLIWSELQTILTMLTQKTYEAKKHLLAKTNVINEKVSKLVQRAFALSNDDIIKNAEILREFIWQESSKKLLKDIAIICQTDTSVLAKAEEDMKSPIMELYYKFWHSEQRLLYFLLNSDTFWEPIIDNYGTETIGIILHIHSSWNFCFRCRHCLAKQASPTGPLYRLLQQKFGNLKFFKIVGSFGRIYTEPNYNQEMPHNVKQEDSKLHVQDVLESEYPQLIIKHIKLKQVDEKSALERN